jgi:molybdopterin-guanine dinucleotide biosynthesis protein A
MMLPVHGFVLAGGKSSRMGRDKATLELAGKPLIEHAVAKLKRVCEQVSVLGENPALGPYGPLVADVHAGCGPIGGIEAALLATNSEWNLIFPVDMPFVPTGVLDNWIWSVLNERPRWFRRVVDTRLSMLAVNSQEFPTLLLIHRDVLPYLQESILRGEYKLILALNGAADAIARARGVTSKRVFWKTQYDEPYAPKKWNADEPWKPNWTYTPAHGETFDEFVNLNTPEDFAEAEKHQDRLDT